MSSTTLLRFHLSSYWRIGSGKGSDAIADALVLRDSAGLPVIPGRTIKGLLRDSMKLATLSGSVREESLSRWFGSPLAGTEQNLKDGDEQEIALEKGRFQSEEGLLWFGSAQLPAAWRKWAKSNPESDVLGELTAYQSSTAIDKDGVAKEHSLRVAEVAVPMDLIAEVRGPSDDKQWVQDLKVTLPLLRALGSRRSRGLGRVDVTLEESR
ncbi:MAG: RAMP superfamily CRISPR-associated protein [Vulcanimicrobiota bacterium]